MGHLERRGGIEPFTARGLSSTTAQTAAETVQQAMVGFRDDALWYKDAVIYQLHVKSFFDSNNDGIGDFAGLIAKLDYIAALGVNTIWLLPFYPSPRRDDGYDISEYKAVHPDYGTMTDVRRFISSAHKRGLRVITELVVNHTSDQHPWFQRARQAKPGSPARDFYVWSDDDKKYDGTRIIFLDTEKSNWTWDPVAKAYFWHRFYSHQPDLNFDNPRVLQAVLGVMSFWLDLGIDGLRLDAVPYLIEREGTSNENLQQTHDILKLIRKELERKYPDRMLLAEANMWPEDVQQYFGDPDSGGGECHMAFHFPLMPRMYMALAEQDRFPITDILRQTPDIPDSCQWAIFLRNHDELTLEMVTDRERDQLWNFYATDRRARINLGIRRRLAPLLERDRRRVELLNSFLLSMPGTPVIYYGDEIGMGDNIYLGDRDGVRTPMQWTSDRNGGFSRADPAGLVLPAIMDPLYGYEAVNVEAQSRDPHSLLNWMRRMLDIRSQHRAFGRGALKLLYPNNRKVLAYLREYEDDTTQGKETILCVANVSPASQAVELDLSSYQGRVPIEMQGGVSFPPVGSDFYQVTLPPYGFYWFVLAEGSRMPLWHKPVPKQMPDYATLVFRRDVVEILQPATRGLLEREVLPQYLPLRRWYGGKQHAIEHVGVAASAVLAPISCDPPNGSPHPANAMLLLEIQVRNTLGNDRYQLPLALTDEADKLSGLPLQLALARARRDRRVNMLTDAFAQDEFACTVLEHMREAATLPSSDGELHFRPTRALAQVAFCSPPEIRRPDSEQSNSSLVINDSMVLKVIRRLAPGVHPEIEMGRYLTEKGYAHAPAMLGDVTRVAADGTPWVLITLQQFIDNQGDAWQWTLETLARVLRLPLTPSESSVAGLEAEQPLLGLTQFAAILGQRLGELHAVLASPTEDEAFAPEIGGAPLVSTWAEHALQQLDSACDVLRRTTGLNEELSTMAQDLLARQEALRQLMLNLASQAGQALAIRIHGDFHLGQVLVTAGDAYIVDFEGEPMRTLEERREKRSPWVDVAGLLRSHAYAAAVAAIKDAQTSTTPALETFEAGGIALGTPTPGGPVVAERTLAEQAVMLNTFLADSRKAFLDAYREAVPPLVLESGELLLDLFLIEKAAYEVCYEAANRPAWIGVPLSGLSGIADRLLKAEAGEF